MASTLRRATEATAVQTASWQATELDAGLVQDELTRLWAELGGPEHGGQAPGEMVAEERYGGGMLMRANTLNLLVVAGSEALAQRTERTISRLTDFYPSRAIILAPHSAQDGERSDPLNVRVSLLEQPAVKDRPAVRFETVTITAPDTYAEQLASVVSPLLVAELPDFLWWPGHRFGGSLLFEDVTELADRLIVDTALLGRDARDLATLGDLLDGGPLIGDFAWHRLAPWRQLIAQFFDPLDVQPCLECLDEITITYSEPAAEDRSGLSAALIAVGWLGSRLGWQALDRLERRRGGWWLPLRSRGSGGSRGHQIVVRLEPASDPFAGFSLMAVRLEARGAAPGTFTIERASPEGLTTTSQTPDMPAVSRMVYAKPPEDPALLGQELQRFGRNRVFEEALAFAVGLLPTGTRTL